MKKNGLFLLGQIFLISLLSASNLEFNKKAAIFTQHKDTFVFFDAGRVIAFHKTTPIALLGFYKKEGKKITAYFTSIDGKKSREIFWLLNKNTIKYQNRLFKREN